MKSVDRPLPSLWCATLVLVYLAMGVGCGDVEQMLQQFAPDPVTETETVPVSATTPAEWQGKSPAELFDLAKAAAKDYDELKRLYESAGGAFRRDAMLRRISEQVQAYRAIEHHPQATEKDRKRAIGRQLALLSEAVDEEIEGCEAQLLALRERLVKSQPGSFHAAMADAVVIRRSQLEQLGDLAATAAVLEQHAQTYPQHVTGPRLYARFARLLLERQMVREAQQVCLLVQRTYDDPQLAEPVNQLAREIQMMQTASAARKAQLNARAAEFGGHYDGYFVLFLRPKQLRFMSPVEYVVAHGLEEAIYAADGAEAWEMEGWFADTPAGYKQAVELSEKLREKNTMEMLDFSS